MQLSFLFESFLDNFSIFPPPNNILMYSSPFGRSWVEPTASMTMVRRIVDGTSMCVEWLECKVHIQKFLSDIFPVVRSLIFGGLLFSITYHSFIYFCNTCSIYLRLLFSIDTARMMDIGPMNWTHTTVALILPFLKVTISSVFGVTMTMVTSEWYRNVHIFEHIFRLIFYHLLTSC